MKLPRDLNGSELAKWLQRYGYEFYHQTGSHIIVRTRENGENSISIPNHKPLKIGTLNSILSDVAGHFGLDKNLVAERLLSRK
jgi:predicted RNA binding protein YcfA (HicA-like mRNA interferase family)